MFGFCRATKQILFRKTIFRLPTPPPPQSPPAPPPVPQSLPACLGLSAPRQASGVRNAELSAHLRSTWRDAQRLACSGQQRLRGLAAKDQAPEGGWPGRKVGGEGGEGGRPGPGFGGENKVEGQPWQGCNYHFSTLFAFWVGVEKKRNDIHHGLQSVCSC